MVLNEIEIPGKFGVFYCYPVVSLFLNGGMAFSETERNREIKKRYIQDYLPL